MVITFNNSANKPKVKTVIGSVKMKRIGFTNVFRIPKTKTTIKAVINESICTPRRIYAAIKTAIELINQFINTLIGIKRIIYSSSFSTSSPELVN